VSNNACSALTPVTCGGVQGQNHWTKGGHHSHKLLQRLDLRLLRNNRRLLVSDQRHHLIHARPSHRHKVGGIHRHRGVDEPLPPRESGKRRRPIAKYDLAFAGTGDMDLRAADVLSIHKGRPDNDALHLFHVCSRSFSEIVTV